MAKHYIKEWRKHRGLTQQRLLDRMESEPGEPFMTAANLSRIERNAQPVTLDQLEAFATALNVTPGMLLEHHPDKDGEIIDLLSRLTEEQRPTVLNMLRAALAS